MLLVDSDVLLDVALARSPHFADSKRILLAVEAGVESAAMSWHSVANLFYVIRQHQTDAAARAYIERVRTALVVPRAGSDDLAFALALPMRDFEGALQVAAARACDARLIVTRNQRDFLNSPALAASPAEALELLR